MSSKWCAGCSPPDPASATARFTAHDCRLCTARDLKRLHRIVVYRQIGLPPPEVDSPFKTHDTQTWRTWRPGTSLLGGRRGVVSAIGTPDRIDERIRAKALAGDKIMASGTPCTAPRTRARMLREIGAGLGGDLIDFATAVERRVVEIPRRTETRP